MTTRYFVVVAYLWLLMALGLVTSSCGGAHLLSATATDKSVSPQAKTLNDAAAELIKQKKVKEALPKAQEAVRLAPTFTEAQKNLARSLCELHRYDEALTPAREAVRLQPDSDQARHVLGKILHGLGQYQDAVGMYKEAIRLNTHYGKAYFNLGLAYDKLNEMSAAVEAVRHAIRLEPQEASYPATLARLLKYTDRTKNPAARLAPPEVDPKTDSHANYKYGAQVRDYLYHEEFDSLDRIADAARSSKERLGGGAWTLQLFYQGLKFPDDLNESSEGAWKYHLEKLEKWMAQKPGSITARVGLAAAYLEYGWQARGGSYANTLSRDSARLFASRMARSAAILEEARSLKVECPHSYAVMMYLAIGQGWEANSFDRLFASATKLEPLYYPYYELKAMYLMPRWNGQPGDWERFADTSSMVVGGTEGSIIYYKIASYVARIQVQDVKGGRFFRGSDISWKRIKAGFSEMVKKYGTSMQVANQICLLAIMSDDKEFSRQMFDEIGEHWDDGLWSSKPVFEHQKRWANNL
ncbi:MAG TPA: tetratricopeptide repeat protein [Pyrinomonadaceae bacterium]|jgi:Flp pilus assembly protein TadD|nr:tetratricopeptide repeat protein [Pyrinomonadaceae bacterium]